ncbi:hypothetical protein OEZ85_010472 [Tetradesmus obliquus]|uniref:Uncharacterized protein n=1 Tax=Tetradesmus obliquus TaxID=3088 RepID=A0ABY8TPI3_TETOB|nr:hypothetical protein OEZ85_010472 [Tetradesmus obliquus]
MSLAVTTAGACSALPADFALTVAEAARRDAEQQPGVLLTRITRHTCQDTQGGTHACLISGLRLRGRSRTALAAARDALVAAGNAGGAAGGLRCSRLPSTCLVFSSSSKPITASGANKQAAGNITAAVPGRPATSPPPSPPPSPSPSLPPSPSPSPGVPRSLLRVSDFKYLGGFALPAAACGQTTAYASGDACCTAYASGGLALRRVGDAIHFYSTTSTVDSSGSTDGGSRIYEVTMPPELSTVAGEWPTATATGSCSDLYGGRRLIDGAYAVWTHGLRYDAARGRLYWSFGDVYNAAARNDPVLGYTLLGNSSSSSSSITAKGPWSVSTAGSNCNAPGCTLHSQKVRGGSLQIPCWFADAYLGGRSLGLGFGGYYSIIGPGSMGPALAAVHEVTDDNSVDAAPDTAPLRDAVTLLSHAATNGYFERFGWRPRDYWIAPPLDWGRNASSSRGYWAPGDSIEGGAVWIDTGSRHALLFFAQLNQGRVAYEDAGQGNTITAESSQAHWLLYDPMDLVAVANGSRKPWQVAPREVVPVAYPATGPSQDTYSGALRRVSGAAWDPEGATLYLLHLNSRSRQARLSSTMWCTPTGWTAERCSN